MPIVINTFICIEGHTDITDRKYTRQWHISSLTLNLLHAKCMSYIVAKCLIFSCHALYIGCIIV